LPPRFLPRLAASISNRFDNTRRWLHLAARGNTPAASVRSTRGKAWRQKPLYAAWVGGECAACFTTAPLWQPSATLAANVFLVTLGRPNAYVFMLTWYQGKSWNIFWLAAADWFAEVRAI
jgi:hypothetical protein